MGARVGGLRGGALPWAEGPCSGRARARAQHLAVPEIAAFSDGLGGPGRAGVGRCPKGHTGGPEAACQSLASSSSPPLTTGIGPKRRCLFASLQGAHRVWNGLMSSTVTKGPHVPFRRLCAPGCPMSAGCACSLVTPWNVLNCCLWCFSQRAGVPLPLCGQWPTAERD